MVSYVRTRQVVRLMVVMGDTRDDTVVESTVLRYFFTFFLQLYTSTPLQFRENIVLFTTLHLLRSYSNFLLIKY